jgi:hypothetical protein
VQVFRGTLAMLLCKIDLIWVEFFKSDYIEKASTSDWWSGAYLKGLTLPRDLRQRGIPGGP